MDGIKTVIQIYRDAGAVVEELINPSETATNRSFKVVLQDESLFLRIGRDHPEQLGIDRQREVHHYKLAESLGLAPALLAYQIDTGTLMSKYIEGASPSEARVHEREFLEKVTRSLKRLHACPSNSRAAETTALLRNDALLNQLTQLGTDHVEQNRLHYWLEVRGAFEEGYYDGIAIGVCHGDLFRGNFLETPEGGLFLVDWEYSYIGPVIDDIGKLCAANWLTEEEIQWVVETYWGAADPRLVHKVVQNIYLQQMHLYLWCHIRAHHECTTAARYLALAARVKEHLNRLAVQAPFRRGV